MPNLRTNPIHLGLGATSVPQPPFTGDGDWYAGYGERSAADGVEGRLVSMHTFTESWDVWEVHPVGTEIVLCTDGEITLIQRKGGRDGDEVITTLQAGEYAINEPGDWHTADVTGPATALFITAGQGTENHPR
ncbi:MAG: cupin [Actinomycetota bacterium]